MRKVGSLPFAPSSQILSVPSRPPETTCRPSGEMATQKTGPCWPSSTCFSVPVLISQSRTVWSTDALAAMPSWDETVTQFTPKPLALITACGAPSESRQTRSVPS